MNEQTKLEAKSMFASGFPDVYLLFSTFSASLRLCGEPLQESESMKSLLEKLGIGELNQGALSGLDRLDCQGEILESVSP